MQLENKAVLVTGAARGMGRATAEQAAEEGARVAVADLNIDGVEAVAKGIRDRGGEAVAIEADVGDLASIDAMVDATHRGVRRHRHPRQQRGHHPVRALP